MIVLERIVLLMTWAFVLSAASVYDVVAQPKDVLPMIGAQVIVEPWQSPDDVDLWFRTMKENGMSVCRIRMFEEYMKDSDGRWDFGCFDVAFDAAARHGIKVFATLFPSAVGENSLGGFKHPSGEKHMQAISDYIAMLVGHYREHPALYGWVLINEPGTGGHLSSDAFTSRKMKDWEQGQKPEDTWTEGYTSGVLNRQRYLVEHNVWYMEWLSEQVRKHDPDSEIHVNNHGIFENVAEYDFPAWRKFLTSLGASAHPSWHFGYFPREKYVMAMGANCQIIRSGAGNLPFWVTELQGGNNTYSGNKAFCPTAEETSQWLWTSIATGAKGIIFWCYNPRTIGEEAGEWCLMTNENTNSDRADAAKAVAECLKKNETLFRTAVPVDSRIAIMYIKESLWVEREMQMNIARDSQWEGRFTGGVMKSCIGMYEALLSRGVNASFCEMAEYDWNRDDYSGQTVILANQIALPSYRIDDLYRFVERGGKLIVEGLTGFYDENIKSLYNVGKPFAGLFGGNLSEVKTTPGDFNVDLEEETPVHLWKGILAPSAGTAMHRDSDGNILSLRNIYGRGEVFWVPSLLAMGARRSSDYAPLSSLLLEECDGNFPQSFAGCEKDVMMTMMQTEKEYVAVLVNKSAEMKKIRLTSTMDGCIMLFSDKTGKVAKRQVTLCPEETMVIKWSKSSEN